MSYRGTGIYVFQQTFPNLQFSDQFFDARRGLMTWTGAEWLNEEDWDIFVACVLQEHFIS